RLKIARYVALVDEQGRLQNGVSAGSAAQTLWSEEQDIQKLLHLSPWQQCLTLLFTNSVYRSTARVPIGFSSSREVVSAEIVIGIEGAQLRSGILSTAAIDLGIVVLAFVVAIVLAVRAADAQLAPLEAVSGQLERLERGELFFQEENSHLAGEIAGRLQMLSKQLAGERTELEQTRGRLTQIVGKIEDRLLLLSPDLRVILMSPKFDHLIGLAGIDLVGAKLDEILSPTHPLLELIERVRETHLSVEHVMRMNHNGLGPKQVLASVQYIEDKGGPIGMLVSLRDFDSFKQFQSQLAYSEKLAALGRITSGVAHEVKNPLNAMVIHLEILRSKIDQPEADLTPQIEILTSEIKRLDRVVQTFLNFTRPVNVNLVPMDLNDLVHQVTRLAATEATAHNVQIKEELSPEFLRINGDADLLKQTLLNIILNGCQAMPRGGLLEIATQSRGNLVEIRVTDHGEGIAPEARDKIFNLYYTTKPNGNGIGLAQAFRAVQLNNGQIDFESELGVGTTFRITLPKL
ncbi:MAG: ATP-binding protein, partial [Nitrososphaerota archaeon]